jgi:hypothetical protein
VPKVIKDTSVVKARRATRAPQVFKVTPEARDHRDIKARPDLVPRAHKVPKVTPEARDHRDIKARPEHRVLRALKVIKEIPDLKARRVIREIPVLRVQPEFQFQMPLFLRLLQALALVVKWCTITIICTSESGQIRGAALPWLSGKR